MFLKDQKCLKENSIAEGWAVGNSPFDVAIKLLSGISGNPKKRTVSAAAKRKMSLAAKKRWAEKKKAK